MLSLSLLQGRRLSGSGESEKKAKKVHDEAGKVKKVKKSHDDEAGESGKKHKGRLLLGKGGEAEDGEAVIKVHKVKKAKGEADGESMKVHKVKAPKEHGESSKGGKKGKHAGEA